MGSNRRRGGRPTATREQLLDATFDLLLNEGYAAVTTRRVAEKAGLKHPVVHYYFETIDDLLVAVVRREAEDALKRMIPLFESDRPLAAIWALNSDPTAGAMAAEFIVLAHRRPAVRSEVKRLAELFRTAEAEAMRRHFEQRGIEGLPPMVATVLMTTVRGTLTWEEMSNISLGHDETLAWIRNLIGVPSPECE